MEEHHAPDRHFEQIAIFTKDINGSTMTPEEVIEWYNKEYPNLVKRHANKIGSVINQLTISRTGKHLRLSLQLRNFCPSISCVVCSSFVGLSYDPDFAVPNCPCMVLGEKVARERTVMALIRYYRKEYLRTLDMPKSVRYWYRRLLSLSL